MGKAPSFGMGLCHAGLRRRLCQTPVGNHGSANGRAWEMAEALGGFAGRGGLGAWERWDAVRRGGRCLTRGKSCTAALGVVAVGRGMGARVYPVRRDPWWGGKSGSVTFHNIVYTSFRCCMDRDRCVPCRDTSSHLGARLVPMDRAAACWETSHGAAESWAR